MKKKLFLLSFILSIGLIISGCDFKKTNINENKETLLIGTSGAYYPFTFSNGSDLEGFEISTWKEIAKRLNYNIKFKTASFSGLFGMLQSDKVTTLANQITITPERKEKYYFTIPTVYSGAQIIVKKDNNSINSFNNLENKTIGVDLGSNYEKIVKDKDKNNKINIKTYQSTDSAFNELLLGRIDAVVIDKVSALSTIKEKGLALKIVGKPIDKIENAYPLLKTPENKELINKINKTISNMKEDGTLKNISLEWLGLDVTTPNSFNEDNISLSTSKEKDIFDFMYAKKIIPVLLGTIKLTLYLSILGMGLGLIIGICLTFIRIYNIPILNLISKIYISFFRGTPLLVQLFLLYFGIPQLIPQLKNMSAITATIIGLGLNASAYISEIFRSSINAINVGQMEACISLGMTKFQGLKRIILPQAFRISIPPLGNIFVDTIKGSSLAFTLGVVELLAKAQMLAATNYKFFESYIIVALIYWIIITFFNFIQGILEKRLSKY